MKWKPINELNRSETQCVLVAQDGEVALLLWNHIRQMWQRYEGYPPPFPDAHDVLPLDICGQPTHFIAIPNAPT